MTKKLRIATIGLLIGALLIPAAAFAEGEGPNRPGDGVRVGGEIVRIDTGELSFALMSQRGEEFTIQTDASTKFHGPDGSVQAFGDLQQGMRAHVGGRPQDDGSLLAHVVVAGAAEDFPEHNRVGGQILSVDLGNESFSLQPRESDPVRFQTGERTQYRGEGVESLGDLKPGMHAMVVAIPQENGAPLAVLVATGEPQDRPDLKKFAGEIAGVDPEQGAFSVTTRDGETIRFGTSERTRYRSRDGSVAGIDDLKAGMMAGVGAIQTEDGSLLALFVGVGTKQDRPELDVMAGGQVVLKASSSFTIQTRDGNRLNLSVDAETHYKGIGSFDELEVGMFAAVGAKETEGGLLAIIVGAREPGERPQRSPEDRPQRTPGQPPFQESSEGISL